MVHMIDPLDFSVEEVGALLDLAGRIEAEPKAYAQACAGKKLATLFYEPSTRTRLSFEAAMLNMGGSILGFSSARFQLRRQRGKRGGHHPRDLLLCGHLRHAPSRRRARPCVAAHYSRIPVINAGDGGHQHPTQTLDGPNDHTQAQEVRSTA